MLEGELFIGEMSLVRESATSSLLAVFTVAGSALEVVGFTSLDLVVFSDGLDGPIADGEAPVTLVVDCVLVVNIVVVVVSVVTSVTGLLMVAVAVVPPDDVVTVFAPVAVVVVGFEAVAVTD